MTGLSESEILQKILAEVTGVKHEVSQLRAEVKELRGRVDGLEQQMQTMQDRMEGLEQQMQTMQDRMGGLEQQMQTMQDRMGGLEHQVNDGFAKVHEELHEVRVIQDAHGKDLAEIREGVSSITRKLTRMGEVLR